MKPKLTRGIRIWCRTAKSQRHRRYPLLALSLHCAWRHDEKRVLKIERPAAPGAYACDRCDGLRQVNVPAQLHSARYGTGRGVCVLDPHGSHPDSLLNMVLRFLIDHQWIKSRRVHIIAPNIRDMVVGFNPLAPLPNTDPAVVAGAMLEAFSRVWGDEDTHKTPLTRRVLRNIFIALSKSGRPLADAAHLLDYEDPLGLRRELIGLVTNRQAKRELEHIERLAREPRGLTEFNAQVLGPANRLAEFLACEAMEHMFR